MNRFFTSNGSLRKSSCILFFICAVLIKVSVAQADEIRLEAEDFQGVGRLVERELCSGKGIYGKWRRLRKTTTIKEPGLYYLWVRYSSGWQMYAESIGLATASNMRTFVIVINDERILINEDTGAHTSWAVERIILPEGRVKIELEAVGVDPYVDVIVLTRDYNYIPAPQKHILSGQVIADGISGRAIIPESKFHLSISRGSGSLTPIVFGTGKAKIDTTECRVHHDGEFLYFDFKCGQDKAALQNNRNNIKESDHVEITLDGNRIMNELCCILAAADGRVEYFKVNKGERYSNWQPGCLIDAKIDNNFWQVKVAVPLHELLDTLPDSPGKMRAGFRRYHAADKLYSGWTDVAAPCEVPAECGELVFTEMDADAWHKMWLRQLNALAVKTGVNKLSATDDITKLWEMEKKVCLALNKQYTPLDETQMVFEGVNLLPNPGFEYGRVNYSHITPYNWYVIEDASLSLTPRARSGKSAMRVKLEGEKCMVSPGSRPYIDSSLDYLWSGWFRNGGEGGVSVEMRVLWYLQDVDKPGPWGQTKYVSDCRIKFEPISEWQEHILYTTPPEGAVRCEFELHVEGKDTVLYCDDFMFDGMGTSPVDFQLPQPGFDARAEKLAVVWSKKIPGTDFILYKGDKKVLTKKLTQYGSSRWKGTAFYADISNITKPGKYKLSISVAGKEHFSPEFVVEEKLYLDYARLASNFFYVQRQGVDVPGWHKANFLDDAILIDRNTGKIVGHRDLSGGWQDAGDPSKQSCSDMSIYGLAEFFENTGLREYNLKEQYPDILSLAWVEVDRQINKCYDGEGLFYSSAVNNMVNSHYIKNVDTGKFQTKPIHKVDPGEWTDNIPNTPDDRFTLYPPDVQWMTSGLAKFARSIKEYDRAVAEQITGIMKENYSIRQQQQTEWRNNPRNRAFNPLNRVARGDGELCRAAIHLHCLSGEQKYRDDAESYAVEIIKVFDKQLYTTNTTHILVSQSYKWSYYHLAISLLEYARYYPDSPLVAEIKRVLEHFVEYSVIERGKDNEFGIVTHIQTGPGLRLTDPSYLESRYVGANLSIAYLGYMAARVGRLLQKPEYLKAADRAAQWMVGRNPKGTSMLIGNGWKFAATSTRLCFCEGHEDGVIPGAVIRGMAARFDTPPDFPALNIASNPGGLANSNMHEVYQADTISLLLVCQELYAARYLDHIE